MLTYLARRVMIAIPTLILISIFVFALQKMLPGDPVLALAGDDRDPETLARLRELYHLNDPIWMQYLQWVKNALQGDLGRSIRTGLPVSDMIAQKLPVTIQLAVMSMIFAAAIGIPAAGAGSTTSPTTAEDGRMSGNIERGMSHTRSISSDQSRVSRSINRVRLALVTSVIWAAPPVNRCSRGHS